MRAYDAVHLATAMILREELEETAKGRTREPTEGGGEPPSVEFMTYDGNLARAASEEGLARDEPRRSGTAEKPA